MCTNAPFENSAKERDELDSMTPSATTKLLATALKASEDARTKQDARMRHLVAKIEQFEQAKSDLCHDMSQLPPEPMGS